MSITVSRIASSPKLELTVLVREGRSETRHTVTIDPTTLARLAGASGATPEELVYAVFAFLLEREPKESIMSRFDVTVVQRYFPEFETEISAYLGTGRQP
ncbi:MAG: hypothetical protein H6Q34_862 [Deltaproteobacteria bacterium]|nr:hypothetical protein [Deltaproteobacteria bacterium]